MDNRKAPETIEEFTTLINKWYQENYHGFRSYFDDAVNNVQPMPTNTPEVMKYDWKNASIEDLCKFFNECYESNLDTSAGQYIERFSWLYYKNEKGLKFMTTHLGRLMTHYYMLINEKKMDSKESKYLVEQWMKELASKMDQYATPKDRHKSLIQYFKDKFKFRQKQISSSQ